ncbi:hypothetical protein PVAP13_3KG453103 [Panicum virgatum]|uniref:Uncharacterized protein n=1 Tax=Panicum virgatum TaxID=38727 RepID=A0A8T0V644_PANVG|nr:hypothetical protein PVAP13_3KG453103 [Panicum virgatum]
MRRKSTGLRTPKKLAGFARWRGRWIRSLACPVPLLCAHPFRTLLAFPPRGSCWLSKSCKAFMALVT